LSFYLALSFHIDLGYVTVIDRYSDSFIVQVFVTSFSKPNTNY